MRYASDTTRARRPVRVRDDARQNTIRKHRPDYMLVVYSALLLGIGAVTVYAISPGITLDRGLSENFFSTRQLVAIVLGAISFLIASQIRLKTWKTFELPLVVFALIVSIAVRLFGEPINGAYRWLDIGGISFQAAELIKFTLVIWLAGYLVRMRQEQRIHETEVLKRIGIAVGLVVFIVAGLQSDLGSAVVMMAIIGFMAFVAGMPFKKLILVASVILILLIGAIVSSDYRRDRVTTFLNPTADCQNEGYQACQALITIGSGGMFGKGLGRSVQAYGYLPEAANDSIFAIVSEKFGFVGASAVIGLFALIFRHMKRIAEAAPNDYARLLVSGILAWLSIQMIINVGAMLGLLPLKGITLPLVSYGGTSIIFVMAAIGIVFHISRYTDLSQASAMGRQKYGNSSRPNSVQRSSSSRRTWNNV